MLQGMSVAEARAKFQAHRPLYEERGVTFDGAASYLPTAFKRDFNLALDAQPGLSTDPNASVPSMLTTYIDPEIYEIAFAPLAMAEILGEERKGDWLTETAMFPVVESAGEVSTYGDLNNNGRVTANTNWPNYQSYLFQTVLEYGDRELERAGLARINWVSELQKSATRVLNTFANLNYAFGQAGLQNYGLLNDPALAAPLTPATKAAGGATWFTTSGAPNATANEVYNDILTVISALINQSQGHIDANSAMTLALSPFSSAALNFTNGFNVNVKTLLKDNYPNLQIKVAPQYGALSANNPQGNAGGNFLQVIAKEVAGQRVGFCAYNERLRSFPIKRELSSYRQKLISGVFGAIIRAPVGIASMLGI